MKVRIMYRNNWFGGLGWTFYPVDVEISDNCAQCGGKRGEPSRINQCEDGEWFSLDTWSNACGHVDYYAEVYVEASDIQVRRERIRPLMLNDDQVLRVQIDRRLGEILFRFESRAGKNWKTYVRLVHKAELEASTDQAELLTKVVGRIREQTEAAVENVGTPTLQEVGA